MVSKLLSDRKRKKTLTTLHISTLALWDLGIAKGRVSTFLPLKALIDKGHKVWYLTNSRQQIEGNFDGINVIKLKNISFIVKERYLNIIITFFNLSFFILVAIFQGLKIHFKYKIDVIYAHCIYSALIASILSRLTRAKYILKFYGTWQAKNFLRKTLISLDFLFQPNLCIVTNDGTNGNYIMKRYKIPKDKFCFWVNGIDKRWSKLALKKELRKKLSLNNEITILSASRLIGSKQIDILIRTIPSIIKKCKKLKVIIVGDGDQRKKLENLAKRLDISKFVKFEGSISHSKVLDYINACDILVSMNALSGINNPVLEAMTCGKPVICLNRGATEDLIKNWYNGILLFNNPTNELAKYILILIRNPRLGKKIGRNAQEFILKYWPTWKIRTNLEANLVESLFSFNYKEFLNIKNKADNFLDLRLFIEAIY